ncbi:hypothetical protein BPNPMPFG_002383 [Mesorhizobium sp. AR07]|uniref:hypothetical protein n=1 Tax=Mesorhizobium sp. AR07 TaxID=2865838 RepID=UPI0021601798|nr:hypothetical protein [Mesorhizobium sp. AR07]UVK46686.1 hypothetical protein BPNPMPFG_002383 [Mesorhizobium sp. AR07]
MDIQTQAEIVLRDAGYETWSWTGSPPLVACFENQTVIGFVHVFDSGADLIRRWEIDQQTVLARHSTALRSAGLKAWNVYSIFLTAEQASPHEQRAVERIEEDFSLARKIARTAVRTPQDVERVLLPLIGVKAQPLLGDANFEARLRSRLKDIPADAVTAFLASTKAEDVARILGDQ